MGDGGCKNSWIWSGTGKSAFTDTKRSEDGRKSCRGDGSRRRRAGTYRGYSKHRKCRCTGNGIRGDFAGGDIKGTENFHE